MRPPSGIQAVVGSPVGTLITVGAACLGPYAWYMSPNAWPLALAGLWLMVWASIAHNAVARYRAYQREWDDMAPGGARRLRSVHPAIRAVVLAVALVGMVTLLASHPERPGYAFALNWLIGGGTLAMVAWLAVRLRRSAGLSWGRRNAEAGLTIVRPCVGSALIRVPELADAYRSLPEHCWRTLDAR